MGLPLRNEVPIGGEICDKLGFGANHGRSSFQLYKSMHDFRKKYKTPNGTLGKDLTDWRSPDIQEQLRGLARSYLVDEGYGASFWPVKNVRSRQMVPQYPIDTDKIVDLLCKLAWRQNINEVKNERRYHEPQRAQARLEASAINSHRDGSKRRSNHPTNEVGESESIDLVRDTTMQDTDQSEYRESSESDTESAVPLKRVRRELVNPTNTRSWGSLGGEAAATRQRRLSSGSSNRRIREIARIRSDPTARISNHRPGQNSDEIPLARQIFPPVSPKETQRHGALIGQKPTESLHQTILAPENPHTHTLRFVIIKNRGPPLTKRAWGIRSMAGKRAETVFDDVRKIAQRQFKTLIFTLNTKEHHEDIIQEGEEDRFAQMQKTFARAIYADVRNNRKHEFVITIEPDKPNAAESVVEDDSDDIDLSQYI